MGSSPLGTGGTATVWEGRVTSLEQLRYACAVKVPSFSTANQREPLRRWLTEAVWSQRLCNDHPNLVSFHAAGYLDEAESLALVMEYTSLGNTATACVHRSSAHCFRAEHKNGMSGTDACFETDDQCDERRGKSGSVNPGFTLGPCKELYSYPLTAPSRTRTVTR